MSLQVWLPLNGSLNNQGLSEVTVTNNGATVDSNGKIGSCYSFDGGTDRVSISDPLPFTEDLTIAAWIKPTNVSSTTTQYALSYNTDTGGTSGHLLGIGMYGSSALAVWCSGTVFTTSVTLVDNTWYHVTASRARTGELKVYVNGSCILTSADSNAPASRWFTIGGRSNSATGGAGGVGYCFKGSINDVRLYDHCLSAKEVKEISKGLICHYKLDNNGFGNPNLCNPSLGEFTGAVPASSYRNFLEQRAIITANANDTYILSYYAKASIDNITLTNHLYNNASNIVQVSYSINSDGYTSSRSDGYSLIRLTTSYKKYWVKWVFNSTSTSATKDLLFRLQSELNTSSVGATVTIKNVKLEKGSVATPWCPHTSDSLYTSLGLDSTTEVDCSGLGNNGAIKNQSSISIEGCSPRYDVSTIFNGTPFIIGQKLDGAKSTDALSLCAWINPSQVSGGYVDSQVSGGYSIVTSYESGGAGLHISKGNIYFQIYSGGYIYVSGGSVSTGTWYHVVGTYDNSKLRIYVNGELKGEVAKTGNITYNSITPWAIAANPSGPSASDGDELFYGKLSDVRIYATALSASDIKELYNTSASIDKNGNMYTYEFKEE